MSTHTDIALSTFDVFGIDNYTPKMEADVIPDYRDDGSIWDIVYQACNDWMLGDYVPQEHNFIEPLTLGETFQKTRFEARQARLGFR